MTRAECVARIERARRDPLPLELWRVNAAGLDTFRGRPAHEALAQLRSPSLAAEQESIVGTVLRRRARRL